MDERELYEEFARSGRVYTSKNGRYTVKQPSGEINLLIYGTALAKENWVYTGEPLSLSEAITLADKWDSEDEGKVISVGEAAERTGFSIRRIQQLIKSGALPAVRFGRDWMIDPAGLQDIPPLQKRGPKPKS